MTDDKPFTICEHCGGLKLKDESLSLVLMFKTTEDRKEFSDLVGSELGLTSYSLDE